MPLADDVFVQTNSGGFTGSSGTLSLPNATENPNTLVAVLMMYGPTVSAFTGWRRVYVAQVTSAQSLYVYERREVPDGETSWGVTLSGSSPVSWVVYELTGLDNSTPITGIEAFGGGSGTGTTATVTTSDLTMTPDKITLVGFGAYNASSSTAPTFSGHTVTTPSGPTLVEDFDQGQASGGTSVGLSVAHSFSEKLGEKWTAQATVSSSRPWAAIMVQYAAEGARSLPMLEKVAGFEWGTTAGLTTTGGGSATPIFDGQTGSPAIVTTTPRTGNYCLELSSTGAAENVHWNATGDSDKVFRFSFRLVGTPAADVQLFSSGTVVLTWRASSGKLGLDPGSSGAEVLSDSAISVDTWVSVDIRSSVAAGVLSCSWAVDGVEQTAPADDTVGAGPMQFGWSSATTATVRFDDIAFATRYRAYPIGDIGLRVIKPTSATIVGTSGNFRTFTSNGGGLAAWNDATALTAISELPPTIGASADGVAQVTADESSYIEVGMDSITAAPTHAIRGARVFMPGWSASATTNTVRMLYQIGSETAEYLIGSAGLASDPGFDNSTTAPVWQADMVRPVTGSIAWTQDRLDGLKFRFGQSSDATPDVGFHALYCEVALAPVRVERVISAENDTFHVDLRMDPHTAAVISYIITTPPGTRGATFTMTVNGVDTSVYVDPDSSREELVGAADWSEVSYISLEPDGIT